MDEKRRKNKRKIYNSCVIDFFNKQNKKEMDEKFNYFFVKVFRLKMDEMDEELNNISKFFIISTAPVTL